MNEKPVTDGVRVVCPKCQKRLRVKATSAGKKVRCPDKACATLIHVPLPLDAEHEVLPRTMVRSSAPRRLWPWLGGGAGAFAIAVGLGIWAFMGGANQPTPAKPSPLQPSDNAAANPVNPQPSQASNEPIQAKQSPAKEAPVAQKLSLPGATGPRQVQLGQPPAPISIKEINVRGEFAEPLKDQKLRSETEEFRLEIVFYGSGPDGTQIGVELLGETGPVPLPPFSAVETRRSPASTTVNLQFTPRDGGSFPDGPYQAKVLINGQAIAALNFSIGGIPDSGVEVAGLLKGTNWVSKYGDGSGYRLEFGDNGNFAAHGLISSGGHKPAWLKKVGAWQSKGDTFSAQADAEEPPRLRTEFRGKYAKGLDELWLKVRHQSKGEDGTVRFGGWYGLAMAKKAAAGGATPSQPVPPTPLGKGKEDFLDLAGAWKSPSGEYPELSFKRDGSGVGTFALEVGGERLLHITRLNIRQENGKSFVDVSVMQGLDTAKFTFLLTLSADKSELELFEAKRDLRFRLVRKNAPDSNAK